MISFIYTMGYEIQPIRIQEGSYIVDGITPDRHVVRFAGAAMCVLVTVFSAWYKIVLQHFLVVYKPLMLCSPGPCAVRT